MENNEELKVTEASVEEVKAEATPVEASEENRLDIISNIYYGTPSLYWAIAMANNIIDPMVVVKGTVLRIPSYESLFVTGGPLIRRG